MKKFETSLAVNARWSGGYAGGPGVGWADEVFGGKVPGPWLCCYMLRRFGWPNAGSDDHKNLVSWDLTTPIKGLWLCVTPYLGGSNLHFSILYNKVVGDKIHADPERDRYIQRQDKFVMRWWRQKGILLYAWGRGKKEGDEDVLIHKFCDDPNDNTVVWGLWARKGTMEKRDLPKNLNMRTWWLEQLIEEKHPGTKFPKWKKRKVGKNFPVVTRFHIQVRAAIKAVMRDLMRPTSVRDISFTPFGDIERTPEAIAHYSNQPSAPRWDGAGYAPEYYFTHRRQIRREQMKNGGKV